MTALFVLSKYVIVMKTLIAKEIGVSRGPDSGKKVAKLDEVPNAESSEGWSLDGMGGMHASHEDVV
jgi:hypothetical protein